MNEEIEIKIGLSERPDDWLAERRAQLKVEASKVKEQDEKIKEEREAIDEEFMRRFTERGSSSTRAGGYTISLREDFNYPQVEDQTELEEFVLRTKKLHLLQKRISSNAIKEELAIREQEKQGFLKYLEENNWDEKSCSRVYWDLRTEEEKDQDTASVNRHVILLRLGKLQDTVKEELENYANLPGIKVVTKQSINAVKRG